MGHNLTFRPPVALLERFNECGIEPFKMISKISLSITCFSNSLSDSYQAN